MNTTTTTASISLMDETKFKINTIHFSPHDLSLFVDSMETIARLTREKEESKCAYKLSTFNDLTRKCIALPRKNFSCNVEDPSDSSADEAALPPAQSKRMAKSSTSDRYEYDETYFSATSSGQTSPSHIAGQQNHMVKSISSVTNSDSEESGIFAMTASQPDVAETQTVFMQPQSNMITKCKSQLTKSRLLRKVRKEEANHMASIQLISCRAVDEYESLDMYQREKQQLLLQAFLRRENYNMKKTSKSKMKSSSPYGTAGEARFLEKALRYLTL